MTDSIKQQFEVWDTLNTSAKDEIEQKSKDDDGFFERMYNLIPFVDNWDGD